MSCYDIVIIDELAAWRGAEHMEPTNGIGGGTNGIGDGITLADGDAVAILRKAATCTSANTSIGDVLRYNVPGNEPSAWQTEEDACMALADMVERDYVRRGDYDFIVEILNCMKAERDEWKAKAKAKSAKRAAAVERLKDVRYHTLEDYVRAMLGWGHEPHFENCRDALIDLLTDDDDCVRSEPGMSENLGSDMGTSEVFNGKGSKVDSREKLEADVRSKVVYSPMVDKGTDAIVASVGDAIGWLDRQAAITEANCRVECEYMRDYLQAELKKRDKRIAELEAELHRSYAAQAAKAEELTLRGVRIAELQKQTKRQAEAIGEWEIRCEALIAERNKWHVRCGKLLDAAHVMLGVTDEWDEEV